MTSLSEQLKRLAVPQCASLIDSREKASILFDSKEAANKTRKTIYDLGCNGLTTLITLNPLFKQFEDTLFKETTLQLERSVEHSEINQLIDQNVRKFLCYLSPYFMLRSAHMCLEWLIRRFEIHNFNRNEYIALILPYHETKIFVKCLQILKIGKENGAWDWLEPLQKPGITLSKKILLHKAATSAEFLTFICNKFSETVKELGKNANILQTQINFYCSVVTGALEKAPEIKDWHISVILPSLLLGFKSDIIDVTSATYIIVSQLCRKTKLTPKLLNKFCSLICEARFDSLRSMTIILLNWIFETQDITEFPRDSLLKLVKNKWLTNVILTLSKGDICIDRFNEYLIIGSLREIMRNHATRATYVSFIDHLLTDCQLSSETAMKVIKCLLNSLHIQKSATFMQKETDTIEIDSDNENGNLKDVEEWFPNILSRLEKQYPNEFDLIIKNEFKDEEYLTSAQAKGLRMWHACKLKNFDKNMSDLCESLYHRNSKIRGLAVKQLVKRINGISNELGELNFLNEVITNRLTDENETVLIEILKIHTNVFIGVLGGQNFARLLSNILYKAQESKQSWNLLAPAVLKHLLDDSLLQILNPNMILLSLVPFFIPCWEDKELFKKNIEKISNGLACRKIEFLAKIQSKDNFQENFLSLLSESNEKPNPEHILKCFEESINGNVNFSINISQLLLFLTACIKKDTSPEISNNIFRSIQLYSSEHNLMYSNEDRKNTNNNARTISLEKYSKFVYTLIQNTRFTNLSSWDLESTSHKFFINIFDFLLLKVFSETNKKENMYWILLLKNVFDYTFPQIESKIEFLSNFFVYENLKEIQNYSALRIRSFKLMNVLLTQQKKCVVENKVCLEIITGLLSLSQTVRQCSLETLDILYKLEGLETTMIGLIENILERKEELLIDNEQFPLVLYTAIIKKKKARTRSNVFDLIIKEITDQNEATFKVKLLESIKHIKNEPSLVKLTTVALHSLDQIKTDSNLSILMSNYGNIFKLFVNRFDECSIKNLINCHENFWLLFEKSFMLHDVLLVENEKLIPVPCIILENLCESAFKYFPDEYKIKLMALIVKAVAVSDNDNIFLTANRLLKQCCLDCCFLLPILNLMVNAFNVEKMQHKSRIAAGTLNCESWKQGIVLLELLENKKLLLNVHALIPILFNILEICSNIEDQSNVEYAKQLTLTIIHQCYQKSKSELNDVLHKIPENAIRIDQIIKCIRESQNPQTNYAALLLLSDCAHVIPQEVLHNIVDIFTFMGSTVARQDDAFSFHIISSIIESIVPVLAGGTASNRSTSMIVPVLKVFSDIMLDVPEHRRVTLYNKLLTTLGPEKYLWVFLCVIFDSLVTNSENTGNHQKRSTEKLPKKVEYAIELVNTFPPDVILQSCIDLITYIQKLPMQKDESKQKVDNTSAEFCIFDVNQRSAKQLRHFKYVLMQFLSTITNSKEFLESISLLGDDKSLQLKPYYQNFIIKILVYAPMVTSAIEKNSESSQIKFWKVILHHSYEILDNAISLLSPDMFMVVINGLMQHKILAIRKKVIEILISKLQKQPDYLNMCDEDNLKSLLQSFNQIIITILPKDENLENCNPNSNETASLQQIALVAIKLISKTFALRHINEFQNILKNLIKIVKTCTHVSKLLLASLILTIVETSSNLKAHCIAHLPKLMPYLIEALEKHANLVQNQGPDNILYALVSGVLKLLETLPMFLSRYIESILVVLSIIWSHIKARIQKQDEQKMNALILNKLSSIWSKIAADIPVRIIIPILTKVYTTLLTAKCVHGIEILMKLLHEILTIWKNSDLVLMHSEISTLFFNAIQFRDCMKDACDFNQIIKTEEEIANAFVAWTLKLSETSFKPLYNQIYKWTMEKEKLKDCVLSYFVLTNKIAQSLKSLFVIFAGDLLQDAARILNECNTSKNKNHFFDGAHQEMKEVLLIKYIFSTLNYIFLYSNKTVISSFHYENLMQPLVDQLENEIVWENSDLQELLYSCLSELVTTTASDVFWKQLNYQILMKTRTNIPDVRIMSFNCCVRIAKKLGEDFNPLLPETIPFIAELLEDENIRVENNTKLAIRDLEIAVGESLQTYF